MTNIQDCNSKLSFSFVCILLGFCILIGRLSYLQIALGPVFAQQSKRNFTRYEQTVSLRGNILDCNGNVLATNRSVTDIYWQGTGSRQLTAHQKEKLNTLYKLLDEPTLHEQAVRKECEQIVRTKYEQTEDLLKTTERYSKKMTLAGDLTFEQLSKIVELFPNDPNIKFITHFKRFYPYQSLASHILGYLGQLNSESEGKTGLEKLFEETLRGRSGSIMRIINSIGAHLAEIEIEKTLQGQHITTTLDLSLQQIAETIFPEDYSGCIIVMDPYTGALKACVSRPTFDPNIFTAPIDQTTWKKLQEQKPFLHRMSCAAYPIGSIFKLVTLSAALETGIIEQHSAWDCRGHITFAGRKYHCVRHEGHGLLTIKFALAHSCNIPFFEIGKKMDIDTLSHYAHIFGLGRTTGSQLPEIAGLIPSREWKLRVKKERWWTGETLSATIGQTFLLATPIQIARLIASIQTGFLVTPYIIADTPIMREPLLIQYETRKFLQKAMHAGVTKGSARWLDRLHDKGFLIHAKTSTAQTSSLEKSKTGKEFLEHSWLACNFTYKNHPPLTLIILTEFTGKIGLPARTAYSFLKEYKKLMDTQPLSEPTLE